MDSISDPLVRQSVVMTSSQVGKTETVNNIVGYFIDQDPSPMLVIQSSISMAEAWSKDRLAPMIRDCPVLAEKVIGAKSRDAGNTLLHKSFPGGSISIAGANAPGELAGRPIRIVLFDEVDRFPASAGTEGDPVTLGIRRTNNFWNRKVIMVSTPTIKGVSRIEQAFLESDQRHFGIPCPRCGERHVLRWGNVIWDSGDPTSARFVCPTCRKEYDEDEKNYAVAHGAWTPTAEFNGKAGFHLNELYSPWRHLHETVREFLESKPHPERLQVFINTSLGETWDAGGMALDEGDLAGRAEKFPAEVPARGLHLTCGVDTQPDRLEMEVVAWGTGEESWSVDYHVIHGDPDIPEGSPGSPWDMLTDYLRRGFRHESGVTLNISMTCIDTGGHNTQAVYAYVKRHRGQRVFGIKGVSGEGQPIVGSPTRKRSGTAKRAIDLYLVGVDQAKGIVMRRLALAEPGPGYCHFPNTRDIEYYRQLTAEKVVTKYVKGFPRREWQKISGRRNEALDCRVYAFAAYVMQPPQFDRVALRIKNAAAELRPAEPAQEPKKEPEKPAEKTSALYPPAEQVQNAPTKPKPRRPRSGGFTQRWRT